MGRSYLTGMGVLPDMYNRGLCMRRECRERFPRHRIQRKPLVSDPGMHHGACVTHVPWCMSGSLTRGVRDSRRTHNPQSYVSDKRPMIGYIHIRPWNSHQCGIFGYFMVVISPHTSIIRQINRILLSPQHRADLWPCANCKHIALSNVAKLRITWMYNQ